ncbi:bifunctional adenosylcobinamide kinase/adenosylcobinamide-phosphate guanylyltransferase [Clostridium nigeriense]|uniref:bifunctional adenosylcobinamide kinase/adenosylcobinamide-phosphate guanylyltransferase n=1 Tax=Clostridium nigeriense TaxID=1805470 RepID=UPI000833C832|nr:bifunctional adenosylcobinamide kinase/adenosylcobinamide-phosphate guanylyltransferase [Clostridium nigeriense]
MILVFGGAYNGKLDFVKEKFNISNDDIFNVNDDLKDLNIDYSKKVINKFHKLTYKFSLENKNLLQFIIENKELFKDKIIISDDISEGIVPLKKEDRTWRESNGKCLQYISKNSSEVFRVFCGIPMVIKSE